MYRMCTTAAYKISTAQNVCYILVWPQARSCVSKFVTELQVWLCSNSVLGTQSTLRSLPEVHVLPVNWTLRMGNDIHAVCTHKKWWAMLTSRQSICLLQLKYNGQSACQAFFWYQDRVPRVDNSRAFSFFHASVYCHLWILCKSVIDIGLDKGLPHV